MSRTTFLAACVTSVVTGLLATCAQPSTTQSTLGQVLSPSATLGKPAAEAVRSHPPEIRLWTGAAPGSPR